MAIAELAAETLLELAERVSSGEASGFTATGYLIAAAAVAKAADDSLNETTPPLVLQPFWGEVSEGLTATREVIGRWFDQEITSAEVLKEMPPIIARISTAIDNAQPVLALLYGLDLTELSRVRQELRDRVPSFFETPTPTPAGAAPSTEVRAKASRPLLCVLVLSGIVDYSSALRFITSARLASSYCGTKGISHRLHRCGSISRGAMGDISHSVPDQDTTGLSYDISHNQFTTALRTRA